MKVKIISSGENDGAWFYSRVGEVFNVTEDNYIYYIVDDNGAIRCIPKHLCDCILEKDNTENQHNNVALSVINKSDASYFERAITQEEITTLNLNKYHVEFLKSVLDHNNTPRLSELCRKEILDMFNE